MYRTVIKGSELQGTAVLDIGEPVRDYARVSLFSFFCAPTGGALEDVSRSIYLYEPEAHLGSGRRMKHL